MMSIVSCRRQNKLQDQQTTNNENIPPIILTQTEKPTRVTKIPDPPPNSLVDSTANLNVKTTER
jgi:hypothetical protein